MAVAEIARGFFGVQLHYADVFAAKAGMPLAEAITFHTNFHRLFAYGNLSKQPADPGIPRAGDARRRLDRPDDAPRRLITAYADRPPDPWPADRFPFGPHFACEAPNAGWRGPHPFPQPLQHGRRRPAARLQPRRSAARS